MMIAMMMTDVRTDVSIFTVNTHLYGEKLKDYYA